MNARYNKALDRWTVTRPDGSTTYRYRWMMEQHLGRRLERHEHVHHINGNQTDDRLENLQVLTASEHKRLHLVDENARRKALREMSWGPNGEACCSECGTSERPYSSLGLCGRCYFRNRARITRGHEPRQPRTMITHVCEMCEREFERPMGRHPKYCSRQCYYDSNRVENRSAA